MSECARHNVVDRVAESDPPQAADQNPARPQPASEPAPAPRAFIGPEALLNPTDTPWRSQRTPDEMSGAERWAHVVRRQSGSQAAAYLRDVRQSGVVRLVRDDEGSPAPVAADGTRSLPPYRPLAPGQRQHTQTEHQDTQGQMDRRDVRDAEHDLDRGEYEET